MNSHPLAPIPDADVDAFWRDGVICLRGLFDAEWIEHMRDAVEDDLAHPGPLAREYATKAGQRFLGDIGAWAVKPGLRKYVEESPAAEIAARDEAARQGMPRLLALRLVVGAEFALFGGKSGR